MIRIFNGKSRGLGESQQAIGMILDFKFREIIHQFPGGMLHVFIALSLHSSEDGTCFPSFRLLEQETGMTRASIATAIDRLCDLRIEGHRVLARRKDAEGKTSNRYLIFPTDEEAEKFEGGSKIEPGVVQFLNQGGSKIEPGVVQKLNLKLNHINNNPLTTNTPASLDERAAEKPEELPYGFLDEKPEKEIQEPEGGGKGKKKNCAPADSLALFLIAQVLAEVTGMDFAKNRGRLFREAKSFEPGDEVRIRREYGPGGMWYEWDWRGMRKEKPALNHIRETWNNLRPPGKPVSEQRQVRAVQYVDADGKILELPA